jgi:Cupin-like domain
MVHPNGRLATEVPTLSRPSASAFYESSNAWRTPVIITNEVSQWSAFREWTVRNLAERFGEIPIQVIRLACGVSKPDPATGFQHLFETMTLKHFVKLTNSSSATLATHYWNQPLMGGPFNSLIDELVIPSLLDKQLLQAVNLWVGQLGCITPLHFDPADNLFCQIKGEKLFRLFSPEDSTYLRPHDKSTKINYVSQIDPLAPDFELFPEFRNARQLDVRVTAGDMLFLPAGWWHHVSSITDSISVNFWYRSMSEGTRVSKP